MIENIAFITTCFYGYYFRHKNTICINNGFSFIDHLFENHEHFFINISSEETTREDVNRLKNELKLFDKIYVSISNYRICFDIIAELFDERFVIGGPAINYLNTKKIEKTTKAQFIKGSFEKYLNVPIQERFTKYWEPYFPNDQIFQYVLTHSNQCYNKCEFCNLYNDEKICRNFEKILQQNLTSNNKQWIFLSKPSITINDLKTIKVLHDKIIKSNTKLFFYIRSDPEIYNFIKNNFDDLSNLEFFNGLEYFSNECLKRINKNTTVENAINLTKMILDKNGTIILSLIKNSPVFTYADLIESINNFKKFFELFIKHQYMFFNHNSRLAFNDISSLLNISKNYTEVKLPEIIDNNKLFFAESNSAGDEKNNTFFNNNFLNKLFVINEKKIGYLNENGICNNLY